MNLFEYDKKLIIHPEAYLLIPFRDILKADKTKNKDKAMKELAYVYYFCDYNSDFSNVLDEADRIVEIKAALELSDQWQPSDLVLKAIKFYRDRQRTPSMHLLETALNFTEKIKNFYDDIDLYEKDKSGKYIHNIVQLQKSMSELPSQVDTIKKLKEVVEKEIGEASSVRGGKEVGIYEDPE
jgi:hypothetical protein